MTCTVLKVFLILYIVSLVSADQSDRFNEFLSTNQDSYVTGYLLSHDGVPSLMDVAFTYDEAISATYFAFSRQCERASRVVNQLVNAPTTSSLLYYSAYSVSNGGIQESDVTTGVNAWVGISFCQFISMCGNNETVLTRSKAIADGILLELIDNALGCARLRPGAAIYSTEHNIDLHSFASFLFKLTGEQKYSDLSTLALTCLDEVMWDATLSRYKRGYNDNLFATDTTAWGLLSLGASHFDEVRAFLNVSDEAALHTVNVVFMSNISVTGYDFTDPSVIGRDPLVSGEFSAQMCAALSEVEKSVPSAVEFSFLKCIGNLSLLERESFAFNGSGIPYSTSPDTPTGHSFNTPNTTHPSVASTVWYLLAAEGANPMVLFSDSTSSGHRTMFSGSKILVFVLLLTIYCI